MTFKGYRTIIYTIAVTLIAVGESADIIQVINPDYYPLALLLGGIGFAVMRYLTDTPLTVASKQSTNTKAPTQLNG